jgi:hypothetical protein
LVRGETRHRLYDQGPPVLGVKTLHGGHTGACSSNTISKPGPEDTNHRGNDDEDEKPERDGNG